MKAITTDQKDIYQTNSTDREIIEKLSTTVVPFSFSFLHFRIESLSKGL